MKKNEFIIPKEVLVVVGRLQSAGFEAYPVGGCVRDILRGETPKDWDVTTSAQPEEILKLFEESFCENKFLTVTVKTGSEDPALAEVEVTTFRAEGRYTDKRHPDEVRFAKTLEEDLSRRDFTVNALALSVAEGMALEVQNVKIKNQNENLKFKIIDPFGGQRDLEAKLIRAVGDPATRFAEDALRMMRAVRLAVELGFKIEEMTKTAIKERAANLEFIARERIRDELIKLLMTPRAKVGIELLHELGLLRIVLPEVEAGIGVENRPKIFTIWEHNLRALDYAAKENYSFLVRVAALLHDVAKPHTKGEQKNGEWTFYGHDVVGARLSAHMLERLHFPRDFIERTIKLIRWHLFKYDPDEGVTDSSVRRLVRNVGADNMADLVRLRICDRMGMGVPKAVPYRLRHFQFRVEKILREEEAPSPKVLKISGTDIMEALGIAPGPKIGHILEVLVQEVIDDPSRNVKEALLARVKELGSLRDEELIEIAEQAEKKVEMVEDERVSEMKAKYYVQ